MNDLVALLVLAAALAGLGYFHWRESQAWRTERADLLNRIMARSYSDFIYTTKTDAATTPQMTTDEAEASWHEENKRAHPEQYPDEALA